MTVTTQYGEVRGISTDTCDIYLGIPYAAPPVGDLMFRHPVPPKPWTGVLDATKGSANPIQAKGEFHIDHNSLDCLYLNIFVPKGKTGPLPVMVWLYGGAFSQGGAGAKAPGSSEVHYNLSRFAAETGCVAVTLNYRLNVYGFLNLHALDDRFDMNNGLFDQIAALRFVRENIAAFGGDASNITLFGQSAGGASVLALMTMPAAEGLFDKVIAQSPCVDHFFSPEESVDFTKRYLKEAGVSAPADLMNLPEERITGANAKYQSSFLLKGDVRCAFSPIIDGKTLPAAPKDAVRHCRMPMMTGTTTEEINLFIRHFPGFVLPIGAALFDLKVEKGKERYRKRFSRAMTNRVFETPLNEMLTGYEGPLWRYQYCYVVPGHKLGCHHCAELPVLFGLNDLFDGADDPRSELVGKAMRRIWGQFAKSAAPGWDAYGQSEYIFRING